MKKALKKAVAIVLTTAMALSCCVPAFAGVDKDTQYNEIELYLQMKNSTVQELKKLGCTASEIEYIKSFNIEDAFMERANMSIQQLEALGYSAKQIDILKAYKGEPITEDSPMLLVAAECVGDIVSGTYATNANQVCVRYTWSWDVSPVFMMTDKVVLTWSASRQSDGLECHVVPVASKTSAKINLHSEATGNPMTTVNADVTIQEMSNNISADIDMQQSGWWAKSGYIEVFLDTSAVPVSKVDFAGACGHKNIVGSLGIGYSLNGLSIIFTPAVGVTKVAEYSETVFL